MTPENLKAFVWKHSSGVDLNPGREARCTDCRKGTGVPADAEHRRIPSLWMLR